MAKEKDREPQSSGQIGLLQKGLIVIQKLITAQQPLSLTGIAEATGIDASSAHRILKILTRDFYVLRDARTRHYVPGPRALFPLGLFHPLDVFRRDTQPIMRSLSDETGQTVAVLVFMKGERVVVDLLLGAGRLAPFYETHLRRPLHSAASGKVLLMGMSPEQREAVLGTPPYQRFTPGTIVDSAQLEAELKKAAQLGYTTAIDEAFVGLSAIAAPIRSTSSVILGSLAIFGLSQTLNPQKISECGEKLRTAAQLFTYMSPSIQALEVMLGSERPSLTDPGAISV